MGSSYEFESSIPFAPKGFVPEDFFKLVYFCVLCHQYRDIGYDADLVFYQGFFVPTLFHFIQTDLIQFVDTTVISVTLSVPPHSSANAVNIYGYDLLVQQVYSVFQKSVA